MESVSPQKNIAIVGGGPSGLFLFKRLLEQHTQPLSITIFEKSDRLGAGMPYSPAGANTEHITNVSDNEIPEIVTPIKEWIQTAPAGLLAQFDMDPDEFNEYKVVPRLLFGAYLTDQFQLLLEQARALRIETTIHYKTAVVDVADAPGSNKVAVITEDGVRTWFDVVIISTGHNWPKREEGRIPNFFNSPYPPSKLKLKTNFPVAIKGASLTAIDAVRTLARCNGRFYKNDDGITTFERAANAPAFKLTLHSLGGLLPAIRFHLEDSHLSKDAVISEEEAQEVMAKNDGFIPLDFLFDRNFKQPIRQQQPEFWEKIKDMKLEEFVEAMMSLRERLDPFVLFKAEYAEAEKSIRRRQSVYWKEELAVLSFAMNNPAKHLSAEDMLRLRTVLMPLISIVIAFVPQSSCRELLALYDAGVLNVVAVDRESKVLPQQDGGAIYEYVDEEGKRQSRQYQLFVDCVGQPHFQLDQFPFKSLRESGTVSPARLQFRSPEAAQRELATGSKHIEQDAAGNWWMQVPGISINDHFQVLDQYGAYNERIYIMAVPYIGGLNPDYSGLDFCEAASARIAKALFADIATANRA